MMINANNLALLLEGKIYPDYACNSVNGITGRSALVDCQYAIRSRILEFTLQLEKTIPQAADVAVAKTSATASPIQKDTITQIAQNVFYGTVTNITNSGQIGSHITVIAKGDYEALRKHVEDVGLPAEDAKQIAEIIKSEPLDENSKELGPKAKTWVLANGKKAVGGAWKIGVGIATDLLTEAARQYWGLK